MRDREGFALLEVLCALAILSIASVAVVREVGAGLQAERAAAVAEERSRRVVQILRVHALMLESDIRARIGITRYGDIAVNVLPRGGRLYEIDVHAADDESRVKTLVYYPE